MPFVKLDCNMLRSTLWYERLQREIFITALLMAEPIFTDKPMPQINVRNLEHSGWEVPPSGDRPYGFVPAAGIGIVRHAIVSNTEADIDEGLSALEKLGEPEQSSRTPDFDGRRLVRVDGGYVILNYGKYRERDYTAAERQQRYRDKHKANETPKRKRNAVTSTSNGVTSRNITHAEAEAEADKKKIGTLTRPTIEQVIELIGETAARDFYDYYESNGWRVGRNPMKSWKSAAHRWKRNQHIVNPTRPSFGRPKEKAPVYPKMTESREATEDEYETMRRIAAEEKEKLKTALNQ